MNILLSFQILKPMINVICHLFNSLLIITSGVTDGGRQGASLPPGKPNVKAGPPLADIADILIFTIILVFSRLLFILRFSGRFHLFS